MPPARVVGLTVLAMLAFAGNSILCRAALRDTTIDAASFTTIRLIAGALTLALIVRFRTSSPGKGNPLSAAALFAYAAAFSFAYRSLTAATGALLLFGAVQTTMIGIGLWTGERLRPSQAVGLAAACAGLLFLLLPGLSAPPLAGALLMLAAGAAWGLYSLRGRGAGDPTTITAGNFLYASPFAIVLTLATWPPGGLNTRGTLYALASGALTSGVGYAVWYTALRGLRPTQAAAIQLCVPVLVTLAGIIFLNEPLTTRLALAAIAILGGIALVMAKP